tara:strand:+ start:121 stop:378 length:258 start_codon:yes stop_codon:yes gene_type:complete
MKIINFKDHKKARDAIWDYEDEGRGPLKTGNTFLRGTDISFHKVVKMVTNEVDIDKDLSVTRLTILCEDEFGKYVEHNISAMTKK